eukprot:SAG25_NODE_2315_length_1727_cov_11.750000_3_plen_202_part_00
MSSVSTHRSLCVQLLAPRLKRRLELPQLLRLCGRRRGPSLSAAAASTTGAAAPGARPPAAPEPATAWPPGRPSSVWLPGSLLPLSSLMLAPHALHESTGRRGLLRALVPGQAIWTRAQTWITPCTPPTVPGLLLLLLLLLTQRWLGTRLGGSAAVVAHVRHPALHSEHAPIRVSACPVASTAAAATSLAVVVTRLYCVTDV